MNTEGWSLICNCHSVAEAELLKGYLAENGIEAVVINKIDSVYLIGEAELYVRSDDTILALQMINQHKT